MMGGRLTKGYRSSSEQSSEQTENYEKIETVRLAIRTAHTLILMPLHADYLIMLIEVCCRGPSLLHVLKNQLQARPYNNAYIVHYGTTCVQPGLDYFKRHFNSSLKETSSAFKAARYFSPLKMNNIQPNAEAIDKLKAFPFINSQAILDVLKGELPSYLSKVSGIDPSIDILDWWKQNESALPCWAAALRKVLLVQPSFVASERVFSLLKSSFNPQQQSSLQDYIEISLVL